MHKGSGLETEPLLFVLDLFPAYCLVSDIIAKFVFIIQCSLRNEANPEHIVCCAAVVLLWGAQA